MGSSHSLLRGVWRTVLQPSANASSNMLISSQEFYRRPLPRMCVSFSSPEGKRLFREALLAGHMEAYFALAGQLCTQDEPAYCGLATLVMILNAFEMDPGRVWKRPWRWYHESMLKCCIPPDILTEGIVMDKFMEIARCHGLDVDLNRVHDSDDIATFRDVVSRMTANENEGFLVACYFRGSLGQTGSGHFAAVGGYHPQRQLVFLFDTARFKYPPHWVPIARLWEGMCQVDKVTGQPRGYMVITRSTTLHSTNSGTELLSQDNNNTTLLLFSISNSARQAYLSPAALCDTYSVGYRLRLVADNWIEWLMSALGDQSNPTELFYKAAKFILDACARHAPRNFFLNIQIIERSPEQQSILDSQHKLLRDLLQSNAGQNVTKAVNSLPIDLFRWFTTDGTFQLPVGSMFPQSFNHNAAACQPRCPFTELSDPCLRLSALLTCFLCSYPYSQLTARLPVNSGPNIACIQMTEALASELDGFALETQNELAVLRNVLWSLFTQGIHPDAAFDLCCGRQSRQHKGG
ncbi:Glutathione gamma-glutamylcysteinyltransferase 1 [Paragonimus heterotremus]|uniref:glutathione gamma-glutamylcysteinyltransferase n=1 Tax=Paragonimus heterotremus TaxID=100268 RepID=A0A8J4SP77_9TREM|nr:Glutathione gamma-glutamylcysteinyltransferase 1 [Paragonimus heterotremus]